MSRPLLASVGDVIRSKDGAVFATVARNLHRGQVMMRDDLIYADGRRRAWGEEIPQPVLDFLYGAGLR